MAHPRSTGRQALVREALAHWSSGVDVLLTGPSGIGRSALFGDIAAALWGQPTMLLRSSPAATDAHLPLVTVIELCSGIPPEYFRALSPHTRHLLHAALHPEDRGGPEPDTRSTCLALLDLMRHIKTAGPVTIMVDDLQWMDRTSAKMLRFVRSRLEPGRLVLVATLRAGDPAPPIWPSPAEHRVLPLRPMPVEELTPILMTHGGACLPLPVAHRIHGVSGGNPAHALAIAEAVRESGRVPDPGMPLPVPGRWHRLARQRMSLLGASAVDTVRLAAVSQRPTLTLLAQATAAAVTGPEAASTLDWETLLDDLAAAAEAGICDVAADGGVEFGHPMLREAIAAQTTMVWRMRWHARLATVVTDPVARARHLALSADPEPQAAAALIHAAELLAGRADWVQAWELADWADRHDAQAAGHLVAGYAVRALLAAARRESVAGSTTHARELARQTIAAARPGTAAEAHARHLLGTWHLLDDEIPEAVTALTQAHGLHRTVVSDDAEVDLVADLAEALAVTGDLRQTRQLLATAPQGHPGILRARAALAFASGSAGEAVTLLSTAAAQLKESADEPDHLVRVLFLAARIERRRRRRAAAQALLHEAAGVCEQADMPVWADRVRAELARLVPTPTGRAGLTPMQERIASLAVNGATNVEIARNLAIGVTTVEGALTQIYRRFDIRSRVELTRKFQ